jgi:hypothetical protein
MHMRAILRFLMIRGLTGIFAASLLLSCATGAKPQPSAARVTLIDGPPFPPSRKIRTVEATDCASTLGQAPQIATAREALRRKAIRYGGNVVGNIMCDVELGPPHSDCWEIARCTGDVACASRSGNPEVDAICL